MAERVFTTLGHWVTLDDDALDEAIRDAGIADPTPKLRRAARELFASALETPGGLKVQTIHALCTRLLQQFPFEANVPARFAVLDDRDQTEMLERASLARDAGCLARARQRHRPRAARRHGECGRRDLQGSLARGLPQPRSFHGLDRCGRQRRSCRAQVSAALGVTANDSIEDIEREIVDGPNLPRSRWEEIARALDTGGKDRARQRRSVARGAARPPAPPRSTNISACS